MKNTFKRYIPLNNVMKKQVDSMLKRLFKNYKLLNSYEWEFIKDIKNKLNNFKGMSKSQYNTLWKIHKERITSVDNKIPKQCSGYNWKMHPKNK